MGGEASERVEFLMGCTKQDGWTAKDVEQEHLKEPVPTMLTQYLTVLLKSHMGSGKSKVIRAQVKAALKSGEDKTTFFMSRAQRDQIRAALTTGLVVCVSGRLAYSQSLRAEFEAEGIPTTLYTETHRGTGGPLVQKGRAFIISPQSLHMLVTDKFLQRAPLELLVLDESETLLQQMDADRTHRENLMSNWGVLLDAVRTSRRVIAADAYLSYRTTAFIRALRDPASTCLIRNTYRPTRGTAVRLAGNDTRAAWERRLLEQVRAGRRVYVVQASCERAHKLAELLRAEGVRVLVHTGQERNLEELRDVNTNWRSYQVVIVTSSVTIGVNFNPPKKVGGHFDMVFLWGRPDCGLVRDHIQSTARPRQLKNSDTSAPALVYATDGCWGHVDVPTEAVIAAHQTVRQAVRADSHAGVLWRTADAVVREVDKSNELEATISRAYYDPLMDRLLDESGYDLKVVSVRLQPTTEVTEVDGADEDDEDDGADAAPMHAYAGIPDITDQARTALERRAKGHELPAVTAEERWQMAKYDFKRHAHAVATGEELAAAWEQLVSAKSKPGHLDAAYWHLGAEKRGVDAVARWAAHCHFDHQRDKTLDSLQYVKRLCELMGLANSVDHGVVVDEGKIAAVVEYLQREEDNIRGFLKDLPRSAATVKDHAWARKLAENLFKRWSGTRLKARRQGKSKQRAQWVVDAPNKIVGQAIGVWADEPAQPELFAAATVAREDETDATMDYE